MSYLRVLSSIDILFLLADNQFASSTTDCVGTNAPSEVYVLVTAEYRGCSEYPSSGSGALANGSMGSDLTGSNGPDIALVGQARETLVQGGLQARIC